MGQTVKGMANVMATMDDAKVISSCRTFHILLLYLYTLVTQNNIYSPLYLCYASMLLKISATMDKFEKLFEDMDVKSAYMESTMDSTTSMATPPDQVDQLIQMVADEAGLKLAGQLDKVRFPTRSRHIVWIKKIYILDSLSFA